MNDGLGSGFPGSVQHVPGSVEDKTRLWSLKRGGFEDFYTMLVSTDANEWVSFLPPPYWPLRTLAVWAGHRQYPDLTCAAADTAHAPDSSPTKSIMIKIMIVYLFVCLFMNVMFFTLVCNTHEKKRVINPTQLYTQYIRFNSAFSPQSLLYLIFKLYFITLLGLFIINILI